jgi:hypothetical protein
LLRAADETASLTMKKRPDSSDLRGPPSLRVKVVFSLFIAGFTIAFGEIAFRLFLARQLSFENSERNLLYRFDPQLGWFPRESSEYVFGDLGIPVRHNRQGFREREFDPVGSKPRIVFFGDSFTWGYNLRETNRFSNLLAARLPGWEVLNMGVSGFGSDQSLLLMKRMLPRVRPSIAVLVFCTINDRDENQRNRVHGGYYKPYMVESKGALQVCGVPARKSALFYYGRYPRLFGRVYWLRVLARVYEGLLLPHEIRVPDITERIIQEMRAVCDAQGCRFVVGLEDHDQPLERSCDEQGIPMVFLGNRARFPGPSAHWNDEGNRIVAQRIYDFLNASNQRPDIRGR